MTQQPVIVPDRCGRIKPLNTQSTLGIEIVPCEHGTIVQLWSYAYNRPVKNGKLLLIRPDGSIVRFVDANPLYTNNRIINVTIK